MLSNRISFMHLHLTNKRRFCVAYEVVESQLRFAVSRCHASEPKYVRAEGRRIASDGLVQRCNHVELHVIKSLAVAALHESLRGANTGVPLSMAGINAVTEAAKKALEDHEDTFGLLSTEFMERVLVFILGKAYLGNIYKGGMSFGLEYFNTDGDTDA
jgi:hypothetical protein